MTPFKYLLLHAQVGVGVGAFISLLSVTVHHATLSMTQFWLLMGMSVVMGLVTTIFDVERLSFISQLSGHFILELLTYTIFIWLTFHDWVITWRSIPTFVVIYVLVFFYFRQQGQNRARRINEKLASRRRADD